MRLGFTGTRRGMTPHQREVVKELILRPTTTRVIHGACDGADVEVDEICAAHNVLRIVYPAAHPASRVAECRVRGGPLIVKPAMAPLRRNRLIVDECDYLVACPHGPEVLRSGTWSTVRYARNKVQVLVVYPEGDAR